MKDVVSAISCSQDVSSATWLWRALWYRGWKHLWTISHKIVLQTRSRTSPRLSIARVVSEPREARCSRSRDANLCSVCSFPLRKRKKLRSDSGLVSIIARGLAPKMSLQALLPSFTKQKKITHI